MAVTAEHETQQNSEERLSDEALARSTGYTWNEWFAILDAQGAADRSRAEIAQFLRDRHGLSLWWANTVNVGYERARADRTEPERTDAYQISASKTFPVAVDRLFSLFVDPSGRERWLGNAGLRLRTSKSNRLARFDWQDGSSRVSAYFTNKGEKSTVRVQHAKLLTADDAEAMRVYWRARLLELQRALDRDATPDP
jgi:hypothetical protein